MDSFYSESELAAIGLKSFGKNVMISKKASFYGAENIVIGSNTRIDDFCFLSGKIQIGNYVHISAYSSLIGGNQGITIEDFANISSRVSIYSISDDYSGETMTNPLIPDKYKNMQSAEVAIERHVIIGCGSVVLPGVVLREGSAFGAMSLINRSAEPWSIHAGIPAKKIKDRRKNLLELEIKFLDEALEENSLKETN